MKFPLKIVGKVVLTTSVVVSAKLRLVDQNGTVIKEAHPAPDEIENEAHKMRETAEWLQKMDTELRRLHAEGIIDEFEE